MNGQLVQLVSPTVNVALPETDLSSLPDPERELAWRRLAQEEGRKTFDLSRAPLIRATVVHISAVEHRLLLTIHHIIADEWSMELIHHEVSQLYGSFARGQPSPLPDLPIQFGDFAAWQRNWLQGDVLQQQLSFWKEELAGAPSIIELATDKPRPASQSFRGATEAFELPAALLERLKDLAREEQATMFMVLEAAFATLLHRYTGQSDILVGTPISGRARSETQRLIGCFLNTIVLRSQFPEAGTFRSLLRQTRDRAVRAYAHPDVPFEHLVAAYVPERDSSRSPLFQVMFILHNPNASSQASKVSGSRELETGTSKLDLTLFIAEHARGLEGLIEYSTDLFDAATIRRLAGHYARLLESIAARPDERISALPMLTDAERQRLLVDWNDTAVDDATPACVHELVEAQASVTPDRVAVAFGAERLTYGELDRRGDELAAPFEGGRSRAGCSRRRSGGAVGRDGRCAPRNSQSGWRLRPSRSFVPARPSGVHGRGQRDARARHALEARSNARR